MNIFVLDKDPRTCARYYCNRHMKIIVEIAQLMCQTRRVLGDKTHISYKEIKQGKNIIRWLAKNSYHYYWTILLGEELCREYTFRYGKIHKTEAVIAECRKSFIARNLTFPLNSLTFPISTILLKNEEVYNHCEEPALAMPDQYKVKGDAIQSYRNYYSLDIFFNIQFEYKKREVPEWIYGIHKVYGLCK